jgi:hypothetical protein
LSSRSKSQAFTIAIPGDSATIYIEKNKRLPIKPEGGRVLIWQRWRKKRDSAKHKG